ncbi:carbohydrate sulfotransferase 11-like [Amphiura filiformis]|uniref:carbohydrate sulfotransferase 11-like n=1 Tax=Amphiura filiformis TaxID=82378 RepID=UPI003B2130FB
MVAWMDRVTAVCINVSCVKHEKLTTMVWQMFKKKCKSITCIVMVATIVFVLHNLNDKDSAAKNKQFKGQSRRQADFLLDAKFNMNMMNEQQEDHQNNHSTPYSTHAEEHPTNKTIVPEIERLQQFEQEQKRRKDLIQTVCEERRAKHAHATELYDDTQRHIYVVDKYKLMFCYIPKVGCSNWKRILMILEDHSRTIDDIDSREAHARNKLKVLRYYPGKQLENRLKNYRKFMFVRHPLSRIVSAYKNKYADLSVFRVAPRELRQYALRIMKKYRKKPTKRELTTGENITWSEWLQYIADPTEQKKFDRHWKEMYKLCSPCAVDYDYIGKLENIKEEADFIMDKLDISHVVRYPDKANSHPTNTSMGGIEEKFKEATKYQLRRISEIYALDFRLFGYTNPFLNSHEDTGIKDTVRNCTEQ